MHRPIASRDFAQRAKEMMTYISFHPVFVNECNSGSVQHILHDFLYDLVFFLYR